MSDSESPPSSESATSESPVYRRLKFANVSECLAELDRIEAAHRDGTLTTTGKWTPGQIMSHLAAWIEFAYDGFPLDAPPFFIRWYLKWLLKKMLSKGEMAAGVDIPGVEGGTLGQDDMEIGAALDRYRAALSRMQSEPAIHNSPAFGKVTDEVRIKVNLMHAQLHLGFLKYPA